MEYRRGIALDAAPPHARYLRQSEPRFCLIATHAAFKCFWQIVFERIEVVVGVDVFRYERRAFESFNRAFSHRKRSSRRDIGKPLTPCITSSRSI